MQGNILNKQEMPSLKIYCIFMLFRKKNLFNRIFTTNRLFVIQEPVTKNLRCNLNFGMLSTSILDLFSDVSFKLVNITFLKSFDNK